MIGKDRFGAFGSASSYAAVLLCSVTASTAVSLWSTNTVPAVASADDTSAVEVGVKFQSVTDGYITQLRFYKGINNLGAHVGHLWASDGTLLASVNFVGETATGWQEQSLEVPVAIDSNTTYTASYSAPQGRYSIDANYFATVGFTNLPLRALMNGEAGGNGVYRYGEGAFPDLSFNAANYWVDVGFQETLGPDTNAPVVLNVNPAAGQTNVSLNTTVEATLNEPIAAGSLTTNTFFLQDETNGVVPATVSPGSVAEVAILSPLNPLTASATYTATLLGGAAGVTDLASNSLASDFSWSFTTAEPDSVAPTVVVVSPGAGAERVAVGTRITASFSEAVDPATVNATTFTLRDASNTVVDASIEYSAATRKATLVPSALLLTETTYSATITGGGSGVKDLAGNALASDYNWSFTTMPDNPYGAGPGGPILVLTDGTNSFNAYYAEILLTEGLNAFSLRDVASLTTGADLAGYDVVIAGDLELTATQVGLLSNWVDSGGNLITMRPDKKLAGLLGLVDDASTLSEGYLLVNTGTSPGAGIVGETIHYHGLADL